MIKNLTISYEYEGVTYTLNVPTPFACNETPRNLVIAFADVVEKSGADANDVLAMMCL